MGGLELSIRRAIRAAVAEAVQAEREGCAREAEATVTEYTRLSTERHGLLHLDGLTLTRRRTPQEIAEAIRARGTLI